MSPGIEHLLREGIFALTLVLLIEGACWALMSRARGASWPRAVRTPLLFCLTVTGVLGIGQVVEDVRAGELVILIAGGAIPAVALAFERAQPSSLGRAKLPVIVLPVLAMGFLIVRGFVIPAIACAQHMTEHAEVHRQWRLEYRALLELERVRAEKHSQSRYHVDAEEMPAADEVEIIGGAGPDGGWGYIATPKSCENCRSFYLDSEDRIMLARRRYPSWDDRRAKMDEVNYLRDVVQRGCYVLGDVLCR